jgi:hypothetical protein
MKGNLYQHIKIRQAYDFSLCFPHEFLMSFWRLFKQPVSCNYLPVECDKKTVKCLSKDKLVMTIY